MRAGASLTGRVTIAVVLMLGFYLLALAIAGGLLYIPYAEVRDGARLHFRSAVICVVGALVILWSVLPRRDEFTAPGPVLLPQAHPRLFQALEGIAEATGQAMPSDVYLVPDLNAWVAQRGGFLGLGSRRVMGLGLPLLRTLTTSEFRAVLAHEFGHFHGGDTKLGPWVYKTRNAMGRTIENLSDSGGLGSLFQLPFRLYATLFLRITQAVSRHQELVADALAARVAGARPLIEGLRRSHAVAPAFDAYWQSECGPVLDAGFRPPLAEGFARYLRSERVAEAVRRGLEEELQHGAQDPYDAHPSLRDRVAAIENQVGCEVGDDAAPALTLLDIVPALEQGMLAWIAGQEAAGTLEPIAWEQVVDKVALPGWERLVDEQRQSLRGIKPEDLPALSRNEAELRERFAEGAPEDHRIPLATATVGAALVLLLRERGWAVSSDLGEPVVVRNGQEHLQPFDLVPQLGAGEIPAEVWRASCERWAIAGCDLDSAVPGSASSSRTTPLARTESGRRARPRSR